MEGCLKVTLPQSGFVQQVIKAGQKYVCCFRPSTILANVFLLKWLRRYMPVIAKSIVAIISSLNDSTEPTGLLSKFAGIDEI
ncbi:MAG: hypothetical protein ACI9T7_001208 [Oleiphilaceae bacterium]|jgi:hypothetical protein